MLPGTRTRRILVLFLSLGLWAALGTGVAGAQEADAVDPYVSDDGQDNGKVASGNEVLSGSTPAPAVESSALAFTGTEILTLAAIGGALVLVGGTVVVSTRRRAELSV